MILHTLNANPASEAFSDCLRIAREGDTILLLGAGVYAARIESLALLTLQANGARLCILEPDARLAGAWPPPEGITPIDMTGWVQLSEQIAQQQAWY